jgi:hypothetical protein
MHPDDKSRTPTDAVLTYVLGKLTKLQAEAKRAAHLVAERSSLQDSLVKAQLGKALASMHAILASIEGALVRAGAAGRPPGKVGVARTSAVMQKVQSDSTDKHSKDDSNEE